MIMMQNREVYFGLKGRKDINPKSQGKNEPQISHLNSKWFSGLKNLQKALWDSLLECFFKE